MVTVGTYEAKIRFSELLDLVAAGEEVAITRHGQEVARLIPASAGAAASSVFLESVARWRKKQRHVRLNGLKVRDLKNSGRR